jgi:spore coat protein U-like protein
MKKIISCAALAAAAIALGGSGAHATTANGTLSVTATVASSCSVTATGVAFGTVPATYIIGTAPTGTGSITVTCTGGLNPVVLLNNGLYHNSPGSGNGGPNYMAGATSGTGHTIGYTLSNTSGGAAWPTSGTGVAAISGTPLPVYGTITQTPGSYVADTYSDTVAITVNY